MPFVTVDGIRLHYLDTGADAAGEGADAPPVLLLHAFPFDSAMWEPQIAALSSRARIIAPDLMGFGRSDVPEDRSSYTMAAYADQVAGLLAHLDVSPVVVVGLSMGGYVAFALLRRHRQLVSALVLVDTKAAADPPEALERRSNQQRQVTEGGTTEVIDTLLQGLLADSTRQDRPELVESTRKLMDQPPAGFVGALEAMKQRPDATDELAGIEVSTLVLVGEADALSPPDVAEAMAKRLPDAQVEVLPRAGHLSNREAADEFNRALEAFLARL